MIISMAIKFFGNEDLFLILESTAINILIVSLAESFLGTGYKTAFWTEDKKASFVHFSLFALPMK
jgi:hypothetical protein